MQLEYYITQTNTAYMEFWTGVFKTKSLVVYAWRTKLFHWFFIYLLLGLLLWIVIKRYDVLRIWETKTVLRLIPIDNAINLRCFKRLLESEFAKCLWNVC